MDRRPHRLARFACRLGLSLAALVALTPTGVALAHDSTGESSAVEVNDRRVTVTAPVPFAELGYRQ